MTKVLSKTGERILLTLIRKVRVLSLQQIADGWFAGCVKNAKSETKSLIDFGFLEDFQDLVGSPLRTTAPLYSWTPTDLHEPDFEKLAYGCRSRWLGEPRNQTIFFATREAVVAMVGFTNGKAPPSMSIWHDHGDGRWRRWQGEDQLKFDGYCRGKTAIPDAAIRNRKNRLEDVIIEIGGQYQANRLSEFHSDYQAYRYEIW